MLIAAFCLFFFLETMLAKNISADSKLITSNYRAFVDIRLGSSQKRRPDYNSNFAAFYFLAVGILSFLGKSRAIFKFGSKINSGCFDQ